MLTSLKDKYNAVVIGASGGLGSAILSCLKTDPKSGFVTGLSRKSQPEVDYNRPETLMQAAQALKDRHSQIDALIIATGILATPDGRPPEKAFSQLSLTSLQSVFHINALGPALALQAFMPLLPRHGRCLVATLSARVGSIGDNQLGGWISYRASKAALNQITHTAAIELVRRNKEAICVALHPGTIETDLSRPFAKNRFTHDAGTSARNLVKVLDGLTAEDSGQFFDYKGQKITW